MAVTLRHTNKLISGRLQNSGISPTCSLLITRVGKFKEMSFLFSAHNKCAVKKMNYLEIVSQLRIEEGYWNLKICVFILFFFYIGHLFVVIPMAGNHHSRLVSVYKLCSKNKLFKTQNHNNQKCNYN